MGSPSPASIEDIISHLLLSALVLLLALACANGCAVQRPSASAAASPAISPWIRPTDVTAPPIWGFKDGLSIGLYPTLGPRGLIRIYTPYLHQTPGRIMQFIAIEPIVDGERDLSEMQTSRGDGHQGKPMWTADTVDLNNPPPSTTALAPGLITTSSSLQTLSFFLIVEPFDNRARPILKISFRSDHPHEVALQTFAAADSARMEACVLTATMGNWARLRHLHLKDATIDAPTLFRNAPSDGWHFFPWHTWPLNDLPIQDGEVTVSATGEPDTTTSADIPEFWRYTGLPARQIWRTAPCPGLRARVNGRTTFWSTTAPIPGGAAYENFELLAPFTPGQAFHFAIEPETPTP